MTAQDSPASLLEIERQLIEDVYSSDVKPSVGKNTYANLLHAYLDHKYHKFYVVQSSNPESLVQYNEAVYTEKRMAEEHCMMANAVDSKREVPWTVVTWEHSNMIPQAMLHCILFSGKYDMTRSYRMYMFDRMFKDMRTIAFHELEPFPPE